MSEPITTNSRAVAFPESGPNRSEVLQEFVNNAVSDIQKLGYNTNLHSGELKDLNTSLLNELGHMRTSIRTLEHTQATIQRNSDINIQHIDFHSKKKLTYAEDTPESNKLIVDQRYGQVSLPATNYTPVFHKEDPSTGDIFEITNLGISVVPLDEPIIAGYEQSVDEGSAKKAFNGHNNDNWARQVSYPLEADVSEVTVSLEVTLPDVINIKSFNTVRINPFPVDRCDILGIWYKPTPNSDWIVLEEYPQSIKGGNPVPSADPVLNSDMIQYIGQERQIYAAKVTLRQRNWIEYNNKRVFIYGLQEFDFKAVEYSTLNSTYSNNELKLNNHAIIELSAPDNNLFNSLIKLESNPTLNLEGSTTDNNHLLVFLSTTPDLNPANIFWKNSSDALPQNSPKVMGFSTYYMIIMMKYVHQTKTINSPFKNGTTPVLNDMILHHKLDTIIAEGEEAVLDTTDWEGRNWALHTQFVSHMDVYRAAVEDGSNVFILGDDFWSGLTHRNSLTDVSISDKLMSLTTSTNAPNGFGNAVYQTITSAVWNSGGSSFVPKRLRFQSVAQTPGNGSKIEYIFNYTTGNGSYSQTFEVSANGLITWSVGQQAQVTSNWYEFDHDTEGDMIDFTLEAKLTNPSIGGEQPILGQFILILKD